MRLAEARGARLGRQAFGLVEDGKYGPATLQAHEAIRSQQAIPPSFPGVNFSF